MNAVDEAVRQAIDEAAGRQRKALRPDATVWVEASAGTGKTKVLVERILTLLLAGAKPERILCLTFTKAAAAEMANRLMQVLADWVAMPVAKLRIALEALDPAEADPSEERLERARALFATVLDAPGGLAIETIHAFCQRLLRRFPLEAGLNPGFEVAEERSAGELIGQARAEVVAEAEEQPDGALARALGDLLLSQGESGLEDLLKRIAGKRGAVERLHEEAPGIDGLTARLAHLLNLDPKEQEERLLREIVADTPTLDLKLFGEALAAGTTNDQKRLPALNAFVDGSETERIERFDTYCTVFLTGAGALRDRMLTNSADQAVPGAKAIGKREGQRLLEGRRRLTAARCLATGRALFVVAATFLERYRLLKQQRNLLDYADLVTIAAALLRQPGVAAWVHYKLDRGIEQLLIDEAQDTSPEQWAVVSALTAEFYSGAGAFEDRRQGEPLRSVFAVGDAKQSIYRFQGADPEGFRSQGEDFEHRASTARLGFERVALSHSFRSVPAVLRAVDAVFAGEQAAEGVIAPGEEPLTHSATRVGQGGLVELWPLVEGETAPANEPWAPPVEQLSEVAPELRLAEIIAARIAGWLGDDRQRRPGGDAWLESRGRPIEAGDILILVRRRKRFFNAVARALKRRGLPVSGADRMVLPDQLVVADLVALGRFLVLPEDDLTLAVVLKGPLFGISEEQLFRLAWDRPASLWQRLCEAAAEDPALAPVQAELQALLARADYQPPFELFAGLLAGGGGRRRIMARLGPEAADPLDEFLAQALVYERDHAPSLDGFLHWLEEGQLEVKRDMEAAGAAVRVMTVHGAKGLEAPVVFLPDTTAEGAPRDSFLVDEKHGTLLPLIGGVRELDAPGKLIESETQAVQREGRRLLYVALTRAADRLYLCGWRPARPMPCWYDLLDSAMESLGESVEVEGLGPVRRLSMAQQAEPRPDRKAPLPAPALKLGKWLDRSAPREPSPPRPLAPSRPAAGAEQPALSPLAGSGTGRFRRGLLIHRLLQSLPDLPPERREAAGRRYLQLAGPDLLPEERESWLAETLAVMALPEAAPLFGPESRAEVALSGRVGAYLVSGQADRLAVTPEAVLLVDYKTNRPPPERLEGVSEAYWQQMAVYRALLAGLYPDRPIRAFLLWTDGPRLMQLSDEGLADRLP